MKRNIAIALFGLASLAAASGAFAQDSGAQVNVPFAFSVSNTTLPAGQYRVIANSSQTILIRAVDQPRLAALSTFIAYEQARSGDCNLVFHKYGERYFLNQVLCPSRAVSVDLPITHREKRARMLEARGPVEDSVLLAMR